MRKRERLSLEFSKIIITTVAIATAIVVAISFILMFRTGDLSPLSYIITGIFAELASATGFYYWKAKRENEIKLQAIYGYLDDDLAFPMNTEAKG